MSDQYVVACAEGCITLPATSKHAREPSECWKRSPDSGFATSSSFGRQQEGRRQFGDPAGLVVLPKAH